MKKTEMTLRRQMAETNQPSNKKEKKRKESKNNNMNKMTEVLHVCTYFKAQ